MKQNIIVSLPRNIREPNLHLFQPYLSYEIDDLKVLRLRNALVTYSGFCISKKGLVKESHHDHPYQYEKYLNEASWYYHDVIENPHHLISLDNGNLYLLIHHPWFNYYHWVCESILRLWMVKESIHQMTLILPDYYAKSDFIVGSLEPFKFENIYYIPSPKSLYIKNLCMPQIKPLCDSYHVKYLNEIRAFYQNYVLNEKNISINLGDKIYISRSKATRKKVINEPEIVDILIKYGFKIIDNEDYTFLEQVSIYSNVKYLISIHGSGLTNMLFMNEGSSVFEIHKKKTNDLNRPSFVFWYQAEALKHKFYHQLAEDLADNEDYFHGNFLIDCNAFEGNIKLMLLDKN